MGTAGNYLYRPAYGEYGYTGYLAMDAALAAADSELTASNIHRLGTTLDHHTNYSLVNGTRAYTGAITGTSLYATNVYATTVTATSFTSTYVLATIVTGDSISANHLSATECYTTTLTADVVSALSDVRAATVTATSVHTTTVTATNITATTVHATTITATNISATNLSGANLYTTTVTATNISATSISATTMTATTFSGTNVKATTVTATNFNGTTVYVTTVTGTNVSATNVCATTVSATNIHASIVTATNISATDISATNMTATLFSGMNVKATTITATTITATTISGGNVNVTTMTASNVFTTTITATNISANSLTAVTISATTYQNVEEAYIPDTFSAAMISANTFSGGNVYVTTLTATNISATTYMGLSMEPLTATNISGTLLCGTNVYATTVTATNVSATSLTGTFYAANGAEATPSITFCGDPDSGFYSYYAPGGSVGFACNGVFQYGFFSGQLYMVPTIYLNWNDDTYLRRDGVANTLAIRNATVGGMNSTFRLYGNYTDTSNYDRFTLKTLSGNGTNSSVYLSAETLGTGNDNIDVIIAPVGTGVISAGGTLSAGNLYATTVTATNVSAAGFSASDGTSSAPGFAYSSQTNTGFYKATSGYIGVALGGNPAIGLYGSGIKVPSSCGFLWSSNGSDGINYATDTGIYRSSAGVVDISGSAASATSTIKATNVYATTVTATTFSGTNSYVTTVTATNISATNSSAGSGYFATRVGIGVTNPTYPLEVKSSTGMALFDDTYGTYGLFLRGDANGGTGGGFIGNKPYGSLVGAGYPFGQAIIFQDAISFLSDDGVTPKSDARNLDARTRMRLTNQGLFGIGTITPCAALDVNGSIYATTVTATTFSGTNSYVTTITATNVSATSLSATSITATNITAVNVSATTYQNLPAGAGADPATAYNGASLTATNISAADISATNMTATLFSGTNVKATTITATNISATEISATTMTATTFSGTNVKATTITATNISATEISATTMTATTFSGTNVKATTITATTITATTFSGVARCINLPADSWVTSAAAGWAGYTFTAGTNLSYGTLDYDKDTDESAYSQSFKLTNYTATSNLTANVYWKTTAVTETQSAVWVLHGKSDTSPIAWDAAFTQLASAASLCPSSTAGTLQTATMTFSAAILANNDVVVLKLQRNADDGTYDTLSADACVVLVTLEWA